MNISPITLPVFLQQYQQKTEKYTLKQPSLSDVFIRSSKPQNTSFSGNQPNQFTIDEFYISDTDNKTYQKYIEQKLEKPALPYAYNELPQVIGAKKISSEKSKRFITTTVINFKKKLSTQVRMSRPRKIPQPPKSTLKN